MKIVIIFILKANIISSAKKVLKNHYAADALIEIIKGYKKRLRQLNAVAPEEDTPGGRIMVDLAVMSVAFFQELKERGQSKESATKILFDVTWLVYQKMAKLTWFVSGMGAKSTYSHLQKATGMFRRFPFSQPSYIWEDVDTERDIIGFNCLKCPVAEYFISHNLAEVCVETWCNLDYPLADKIWHSELIRTGSIASGSEICDFRWKVKS